MLICKRFYALTLFKELGITKSQSTNTYEHRKNVNQDTLLEKHSDDLSRSFGDSVPEDNKRTLLIYRLPKLRRNPIKLQLQPVL